jgi:hypothetical protein
VTADEFAALVNGGPEEHADPPPSPPVTREFERVNEPPAAPRRGWWKRLTE